MNDVLAAPKRPTWVRLGLWGIYTRHAAMSFVWVSLALAVGSGVYGIFNPWGFFGLGLAFSALWYWQAIKWVDRNDRWADGQPGAGKSTPGS